MILRLLLAILILPVNAMIVIPLIILYINEWEKDLTIIGESWIQEALGIACIGIGLYIAIWTMLLFVKKGKGTPAPWDPPKKLVIEGPYCHMRNPMITGVIMILFGEALILHSKALLGWALLFFFLNLIYFPLVEEVMLEKKFGEAYRIYKKHVPRWIPRLNPWKPKETTS